MHTPKVGGRYKRQADGTIVPVTDNQNTLATADPDAWGEALPQLESAEGSDADSDTDTPE